MTDQQNRFVWYELITTDKSAAEAFYRDVVGWKMADSGMAGMDYTIISADHPVGGLMAMPPHMAEAGAHPSWSGYVGVDDVDAFSVRVAEAGGTVHRPAADIPGVGRFAVVSDPQGAAFVLFQAAPGQQPSPVPSMQPGHVGWHELHAGEWEGAFAFYSALFGWTKDNTVDMGPMGTYQLFSANGHQIGGMMTKGPATPAPFWLYYFTVDSILAALARVETAQGRRVFGPTEVPGELWVAQCVDPQGVMFALVGPHG